MEWPARWRCSWSSHFPVEAVALVGNAVDGGELDLAARPSGAEQQRRAGGAHGLRQRATLQRKPRQGGVFHGLQRPAVGVLAGDEVGVRLHAFTAVRAASTSRPNITAAM